MRHPIPIITLAAALLALLPPPSASAGSYEVTACFGAENASWTPWKAGPGVVAYASCPGGIDASRGVAGEGLYVRNVLGRGQGGARRRGGLPLRRAGRHDDHRDRLRRAAAAQPGLARRPAGRRRPLAVVRRPLLDLGEPLGPRRAARPRDDTAVVDRALRQRVLPARPAPGLRRPARRAREPVGPGGAHARRADRRAATAGCAAGSRSPRRRATRRASAASGSRSTAAPCTSRRAPATSPGRCRARAARCAPCSTRAGWPTACTGCAPASPTRAGTGRGANGCSAWTTPRRPSRSSGSTAGRAGARSPGGSPGWCSRPRAARRSRAPC